MTDTPTASSEAREIARDIAHVATPTCRNRPITHRIKTPHSRTCDRLADTIARALDAYAAPLREEIDALRADAAIKVANARREALEEAALVAEGYDAALNGKAMRPFAHDPDTASAVMRRDFAIASRIRALAQEDGNG